MVQLTARRRLEFGFLSGLVLSLAFLARQGDLLAGSSWAGMIILIFASLGARPWAAALVGFAHGVSFYTVTLPWIYTVMRVHGGLPVLDRKSVV